jgi:hypothetical protein
MVAKGRGWWQSDIPRLGRILTPSQVQEIRRRWEEGESQPSLAREFGISKSLAHLVTSRQAYKDVK